jgi:uncharacterized membrane protein HdeD (DUF308 family)
MYAAGLILVLSTYFSMTWPALVLGVAGVAVGSSALTYALLKWRELKEKESAK